MTKLPWPLLVAVQVMLLAASATALPIKARTIATGLTPTPVHVTAPRGNTAQIYVCTQNGVIYVMDKSGGSRRVFMDMSSLVAVNGESGMLSMVFHPSYSTNRRFFAAWVDSSLTWHVAEFRADSAGRNGVLSTRRNLMSFTKPNGQTNHNSGMLHFGPNGYLYIGIGDGGGANDPFLNAENRYRIWGKILRIDVNCATRPYCIPASNPFASSTGGYKEVFLTGLRNPWKFAIDGYALVIADVGQATVEEVDVLDARRPQNLGWSKFEGRNCFRPPCDTTRGYTMPVYSYLHTGAGAGCSIIGGAVYHGNAAPAARGRFFFGDFCSGIVQSLALSNYQFVAGSVLTHTGDLGNFGGLTSFGIAGGELYFTTIDGMLRQIVAA